MLNSKLFYCGGDIVTEYLKGCLPPVSMESILMCDSSLKRMVGSESVWVMTVGISVCMKLLEEA